LSWTLPHTVGFLHAALPTACLENLGGAAAPPLFLILSKNKNRSGYIGYVILFFVQLNFFWRSKKLWKDY